jgi:DNA-binding transcriptional LysR family regulator
MRTLPDWVTLRIYLAAVELGSITRAGERCDIATAAAAKRIQVLEADCGLPLLERSARGVQPTNAGEAFARYARALLDLAARLAADLGALASGGLGSVRLHATASALAGHELAASLAAFAAERPGVQVDLQEHASLHILQDLMEGRADLGIITSGGRIPPGLEGHRWRQDRLLAVVAASHPLASCASVRFDEVLSFPLVGALAHSALALLLEDRAERLGRRLGYRFRVGSTDAARRLAASGHVITVMPDGLVRPYETTLGIRGVPLSDRWSRRRLRIVARAADMLPLPARLLLDHLLKPETRPASP